MGKFIIDNVLIEKSDKDINTGIKYTFSEGKTNSLIPNIASTIYWGLFPTKT